MPSKQSKKRAEKKKWERILNDQKLNMKRGKHPYLKYWGDVGRKDPQPKEEVY